MHELDAAGAAVAEAGLLGGGDVSGREGANTVGVAGVDHRELHFHLDAGVHGLCGLLVHICLIYIV